MLDSHLVEIARLLFQVGGGVAWALLFFLSWKMLTIIEKVVQNDQGYCERHKAEGGSSSESRVGTDG